MSTTHFQETLQRLVRGERLLREDARSAMDAIMNGHTTPAQIGAFLMALRMRGETPEEIAGAAESMRAHALRIEINKSPVIDTCGTGGDGSGTFNISTAASFVVAAGGVPVAKHGNRSVSSRCGSADVLEALGARIDLPPEGVKACLEACGVGFMFAPLHHGAMKHAVGPRKELAMRTLFNILGPLCNPADVTHQLMGVFDPELTETLARVLALLGSEGAMVVHGAGGVDELSLEGPSRVSEWRSGVLKTYSVSPEQLGLSPAPLSTLRGGEAGENAAVIVSILGERNGPERDIVCLNAGAALYCAGAVEDLRGGVIRAREVIERGDARDSLETFVRFTRSWTG